MWSTCTSLFKANRNKMSFLKTMVIMKLWFGVLRVNSASSSLHVLLWICAVLIYNMDTKSYTRVFIIFLNGEWKYWSLNKISGRIPMHHADITNLSQWRVFWPLHIFFFLPIQPVIQLVDMDLWPDRHQDRLSCKSVQFDCLKKGDLRSFFPHVIVSC